MRTKSLFLALTCLFSFNALSFASAPSESLSWSSLSYSVKGRQGTLRPDISKTLDELEEEFAKTHALQTTQEEGMKDCFYRGVFYQTLKQSFPQEVGTLFLGMTSRLAKLGFLGEFAGCAEEKLLFPKHTQAILELFQQSLQTSTDFRYVTTLFTSMYCRRGILFCQAKDVSQALGIFYQSEFFQERNGYAEINPKGMLGFYLELLFGPEERIWEIFDGFSSVDLQAFFLRDIFEKRRDFSWRNVPKPAIPQSRLPQVLDVLKKTNQNMDYYLDYLFETSQIQSPQDIADLFSTRIESTVSRLKQSMPGKIFDVYVALSSPTAQFRFLVALTRQGIDIPKEYEAIVLERANMPLSPDEAQERWQYLEAHKGTGGQMIPQVYMSFYLEGLNKKLEGQQKKHKILDAFSLVSALLKSKRVPSASSPALYTLLSRLFESKKIKDSAKKDLMEDTIKVYGEDHPVSVAVLEVFIAHMKKNEKETVDKKLLLQKWGGRPQAAIAFDESSLK